MARLTWQTTLAIPCGLARSRWREPMRERRPHIAAVVAAAGLVIASGSAFGATNLVQNPGFETGDFSSWTADGWVVVTSFGLITGPNSGTFFAAESCPNGGCTNTLSQTI